MALGVLIDATIVRALLVPALMRLLGRGELVGARAVAAVPPAVRHPRGERDRLSVPEGVVVVGPGCR